MQRVKSIFEGDKSIGVKNQKLTHKNDFIPEAMMNKANTNTNLIA